jgi:MFS transporter, MHS family, proline/betaine transporter
MRIKSIISSSIGNILEWYDFGLFAVYSPLFSRLFFPASDPHLALISTFGIFAVGFLCRPLGALLFGYLGDTQGRAKTLRLSILLISLPTLLIGCIPTYASAGIIAPLLLVLIRIWQGISLGGEFSGNIIYLMETSPLAHRATLTSLAATGANLGILFAAAVSYFLTAFLNDSTFSAWGWRIPYFLSGIICIFIFMTRLQMQETPVFEYLKNKKLLVKNPIKIVFKTNMPYVLRTMGLVCMGNTFYYLCFIYMPAFLVDKLNFSLHESSLLVTFFIASMLILVPLSGMLCDQVDRKKLLLFNALLIMGITVPGFYLLINHYLFSAILILSLFTLASSLDQGTTNVAVVENYPLPARYTGLSLGYNLGVGLFGGTAPLICEWLINTTHSLLSPAFYIVLCAFITAFVVYFFIQTQNKALTPEFPRG